MIIIEIILIYRKRELKIRDLYPLDIKLLGLFENGKNDYSKECFIKDERY